MSDHPLDSDVFDRSQVVRGWAFVGVQGVLLAILVLWAPSPTWSIPGWLNTVGIAIGLFGMVWLLVGGLNLGRSLTATPVPRDEAVLKTGGLYQLSRHPIYTGVIALAVSSAMRRGNWVLYLVAGLLYALFEFKSRFEEGLLTKRYGGYAAYALKVPRFLPIGRRLW